MKLHSTGIMALNSDDKLNVVNIGLMVLSTVVAFIVPFEMFLFAYAVLGPLHYLTEISWLHDRGFYTKGKYDFVFLLAVGILITLSQYSPKLNKLGDSFIYVAFFSSLIFLTVKDKWLKLFGILLVILSYQLFANYKIFFSVFLPTLIHVYVFTGCFIIYGALKTRSKTGVLSFVIFILCALSFLFLWKDVSFIDITSYGRSAYQKFEALNYYTLKLVGHSDFPSQESFVNTVYHSSTGIIIMRFIAFAYTYHYLNWFSKTSVIKWHNVPKKRLAIIAALWIFSVTLYAVDYSLGFEWLFFVSFLHVFLEFPLNYLSFIGIFNEVKTIIKKRSFSAPGNVNKN